MSFCDIKKHLKIEKDMEDVKNRLDQIDKSHKEDVIKLTQEQKDAIEKEWAKAWLDIINIKKEINELKKNKKL